MSDDTALLLAHPGFSEVQDGIEHLEGSGCMWSSAEAIRLLDQQNNARGREIDRLKAVIARVERTQTEMHRIAEIGQHHIQRVAFENAAALLADALSGLGHSEITDTPQAPAATAPLHYTLTGTRSVCGETAKLKGGGQFRLAFDPEDDQIDCAGCRLFLAGVRAGKGGT